MVQPASLTIKPLTPSRWPDFEKLFGPRGACGGCWCMFWKLPNKGLTVALLRACIEHVRKHGGKIIEGYPTEPKAGKLPAPFVYTGLASAFRAAGFHEVARRSESRPIFRYSIEGSE